jgi:hypothetical protein
MRGAINSTPQYAFVAWRSVRNKSTGTRMQDEYKCKEFLLFIIASRSVLESPVKWVRGDLSPGIYTFIAWD